MAARQPEPVPAQQQGQQLHRGHSVWLAPDRFEVPDFSPDQCVAELRRYVSATQWGRHMELRGRSSTCFGVPAGATANSEGRAADSSRPPEEPGANLLQATAQFHHVPRHKQHQTIGRHSSCKAYGIAAALLGFSTAG